jgi:hypothetical protein
MSSPSQRALIDGDSRNPQHLRDFLWCVEFIYHFVGS